MISPVIAAEMVRYSSVDPNRLMSLCEVIVMSSTPPLSAEPVYPESPRRFRKFEDVEERVARVEERIRRAEERASDMQRLATRLVELGRKARQGLASTA